MLSKVLTPQEKPELTYKTVRMRDFDFASVTLDFDFEVKNPYGVGISLASLDYELQVNQKKLLQGQTNKELSVPAHGSSIVTLPYKVEFLELGEALVSLFQAKDELPYRLAVTFGLDTPIGVVPVPIKTEGKLPLPRLPDVKMGGVKMGETNLTGTTVVFDVDVKNKGNFPLKVKSSQMDVKISGVSVSQTQLQVPEVPAGETAKVQIPVKLSFFKLGGAVVKAIQNKKIDYDLGGALDLGVLKRDFSLKGQTDL